MKQWTITYLILSSFWLLTSGCISYHDTEVINESNSHLSSVQVTYIDSDWSFTFGNLIPRSSATFGCNEAAIPQQANVEWRDEQTGSYYNQIVSVRRSIPSSVNLRNDNICFLITSPTNASLAFWKDYGEYRLLSVVGESDASKRQRELNNRLIQALRERNLSLAKKCIEDGAEVDCHRLGTSTTPLSAAIGDINCVNLLIENRAPIRWELPLAAMEGDTNIVEVLLKSGADINYAEAWKNSPLTAAIVAGKTSMVRFLLENGANVNASIYNGITPLYSSVLYNRYEIAEMLVAEGANIEASLTGKKWTPVDMARSKNDEKMLNILTASYEKK